VWCGIVFGLKTEKETAHVRARAERTKYSNDDRCTCRKKHRKLRSSWFNEHVLSNRFETVHTAGEEPKSKLKTTDMWNSLYGRAATPALFILQI
jgi:hypothetical protein